MIEFDPKKAKINLEKHGLAFVDAEPVFLDERALLSECFVRNGSAGKTERCDASCHAQLHENAPRYACAGCELRLITTGLDANEKLVTVVSTKRNGKDRIISMRRARRKERRLYDGT